MTGRRCPTSAATALALAAAVFLSACEEEKTETAQNEPRPIKTITVSERGSGQLRRFPGVVHAVDTATLSFEVAGNTRQMNVENGDRVNEGRVLATLDKSPFEISVKAAEAALGRARAQLAEKETQYQRQKTLFEKEWVSQSAYDQAFAARESARNEVSYASSQLNLAKRDLQKTELAAPFDGVIAKKHVEAFEEVSRGQPIYDIYVDGAMEVRLSVPETSIRDIYLGLPATVEFPARDLPLLSGRVSEVGTVAGDANAFPAKVVLEGAPPEVLPGMTAEVGLLVGSEAVRTSYLVPVSAIAPGEEPRTGYVFVYDPETSTVEQVPIKTAGISDNNVVISEGVTGGDIIAVAGVTFLRDGQKVRLLDDRTVRTGVERARAE